MKISFIVPVYNVEKYLIECLESLINQTYEDIEIIAVNDGSTDGSLVILEKYACKDKRIRIINQKNYGLSAARNTGMMYASGDYIFFVDSDDYISLDSARILYDNISCFSPENYPDIIFFSIYTLKNGILSEVKYSCDKKELTNGIETLEFLIKNKMLNASVSSKVFRSKFLIDNSIRFIEGIRYEDMYYTIKSLILSKKDLSISDRLYVYRLDNTGSITNTIRHNDTDVLITLHEIVDILYNNYPDFEKSQIWRERMFSWICNATFFKYPIKNFWSKIGWNNCKSIKQDSLFREYLKDTCRKSKSLNLKMAAILININLALFYIVRFWSKKLFHNKYF